MSEEAIGSPECDATFRQLKSGRCASFSQPSMPARAASHNGCKAILRPGAYDVPRCCGYSGPGFGV